MKTGISDNKATIKVDRIKGGSLSESQLKAMLELDGEAFSEQHSPIPLLRPLTELKESLLHPDSIILVASNLQDEVKGFVVLFPTYSIAADRLFPWVDFSFYRNDLNGLAWYVSVIVVKRESLARHIGSLLMEHMRFWYNQNKIQILSFDCNTHYSGFLPLAIWRMSKVNKSFFFPSPLIAYLLMLLGGKGVHANPVWFVCRSKQLYNLVKSKLLSTRSKKRWTNAKYFINLIFKG